MAVVFTDSATADLDEILTYTSRHFPMQLSALEARIRDVLTRIELRPKSARAVIQRPGVRVVPLLRYPFRVFYRESDTGIEILHIHHTARSWPEG